MTSASKPTRRELSHGRILDAAARAVRTQGFAGVGVSDVMQEAGLTHGGFYAHFESRDALLAAAVEHAAAQSGAILSGRIARLAALGASPLRALVDAYLGDEHVDSCEAGCPVAALGSEIARQSGDVHDVARERVARLVARVREALGPGSSETRAFALAGSLVGAVQLARALGEPGKAMLPATRDALVAQFERPE